MSPALSRGLSVLALTALVACGSGGGAPARDAAAGSGGGDASVAGTTGASGTTGTAGTTGAAGGAGGAGSSGGAGTTGAAGTAGTTGQAGGTTGAAGAAGTTGGGGTSGTTGAAGTGAPTTGAAGGTFVMCDDHADFNGRGLCSPTGKFGAVVARQSVSASGTLTTLTAAFSTGKPATDPGCTAEAVGAACTAVTCPRGAPKNVAGPEAGAITAKSNGGSIVTKPDATGAYDVAGLAGALWSQTKAALSFSAAGGAVPAFSETFCGPPPATLTKPAAVPGAGLTIDRANDLAVQWTGGTVGDLEIVMREEGASISTDTLEVRCFFTGSAGQGTIPKAALAKISAGAHAVASYQWVRKIALPAGGTCVEITGVATNAAAGGAPWNGNATFQ